MKNAQKTLIVTLKIVASVLVLYVSTFIGLFTALYLEGAVGISTLLAGLSWLVLPSFFLPLLWLRRKKAFLKVWLIAFLLYLAALTVNYGIVKHEESITIDTSPNIDVSVYMPFDEASKIYKKDDASLKLSENLPRIDGAAALFPVYSGFVHAVYPSSTVLSGEGAFRYGNTPLGYRQLARKETDIFIGVYPSDEQKAYAEECNTTFEYTPIGTEAFVFFVHKENPIENLTSEQIRKIYSGEITNWSEIGGSDEEIVAYQRNEGSGSQSMLLRFMGDTPLMKAPTEQVNDLMVGIIERVSDYKSKKGSIGFSFRYYVEGIIKNPDIKMLSVDGVSPTAENIKLGRYPIVTPIYAVTYEEQTNENVERLLDWILSAEGQEIIEGTGYVGIVK